MIFPFPRRKDLNVILFTSIFYADKTLTEITLKTSFIIRTLSIFRVSNLYFIDDLKDSKVKKTVMDIINYALLPPYLKKKIPLKPTLKKVGLLNPVNIPSHMVEKEAIEGEYRVGDNGNFGLKSKISANSKTILVINSNPLKVIPYDFFPYYNGFKTKFIEQDQISSFDNIIVGSRSGKNPFEEINRIKELYEKRGITLLIGPPQGGVLKNINVGKKYVYNFVPNQGVKDIRAEEALLISLSILNFILG